MQKAFTLVELLVVVLIIGILSAVALPQYQKAVIKSRFTEALTNLKAISDAVKVCELSNGNGSEACDIFSSLSVDVGQSDPNYTGGGVDNIHFTNNFMYSPSGVENTPQAWYRQADACVCILENGEFAVGMNDGCHDDEFQYDIGKLLGIAQHCDCC